MSDIANLFARDPHKLTRDDITQIVEKLRSMRHVFNSGISSGGNVKKLTAKETAIKALDIKVEL